MIAGCDRSAFALSGRYVPEWHVAVEAARVRCAGIRGAISENVHVDHRVAPGTDTRLPSVKESLPGRVTVSPRGHRRAGCSPDPHAGRTRYAGREWLRTSPLRPGRAVRYRNAGGTAMDRLHQAVSRPVPHRP